MPAPAALPAALLWLLPAVFALHEAEETLFLPPWLRRNRDYLARRFPRLARRMLPVIDSMTSVKFAAMAAEELLLLLAVTLYAALSGDCRPWLAFFLAFGAHLLLHVGQWIAVGRFVPVVATSLTGLLYCGWGLHAMRSLHCFTPGEWLFCASAGGVAAAVNLYLLHALASKFTDGRRVG